MTFPESVDSLTAPAEAPPAYQAQAPTVAEASQPAVSFAPPIPDAPNPSTAAAEQGPAASHPVDVASWAASALQSLSLSSGTTKGTRVPLSIPIDQALGKDGTGMPMMKRVGVISQPSISRSERDRSSLRRRDALLQGREGTRQRRRWENDHFKNVPNAQPPLPSDWAVQPTHPVVHVPYHLARYWDDIAASKAANNTGGGKAAKAAREQIGRIPREVKESAKRNAAFKGWVRAIEEPIRWFVLNRQAAMIHKQQQDNSATAAAGVASVDSSVATLVSLPTSPSKESGRDDMEMVTDASDEEMIVFRGRGRGRSTREDRPSLAQSMSMSSPFTAFNHSNNNGTAGFRPREERKSVLALQRDEDWEELVAVGTRSRTVSAASSTVLLDHSSAGGGDDGGYGHAEVSSWRVVPGDKAAGAGPAAMLFAPDGSSSATYKRWIVHSVALYYGLYSASVDDSETMLRYVFVGPPKMGRKSRKRASEAQIPDELWEQL